LRSRTGGAMTLHEAEHLNQVVAARARMELASLDFKRSIQNAAEHLRQKTIAEWARLSEPRVSQIIHRTDRIRPGFSGASPTEVAQRYAVGEISEQQTVDELSRWEYRPMPAADPFDETWDPGSGTWLEVEDAWFARLITDAMFGAIRANRRNLGTDH
jgi:hypothetical protein